MKLVSIWRHGVCIYMGPFDKAHDAAFNLMLGRSQHFLDCARRVHESRDIASLREAGIETGYFHVETKEVN